MQVIIGIIVHTSYNYVTGDAELDMYIRKNGDMLQETKHSSYYYGPSGYISDQGGRTIVSNNNNINYQLVLILILSDTSPGQGGNC